jgi:2-polyprenyl-3-methyl-5-hydroxy-6-metoxy-1,4-benzoquinol methylase
MKMEQFTCSLCGGKESSNCFTAFDFDSSVEPFQLVQCTGCSLTIIQPTPPPDSLDEYYPESYYGSGKRKFSGVIEFLTVLSCKLRAKKVVKQISRKKSGLHVNKILDVGCGRANLLQHLRGLGCECYGTERAKFPDDGNLDGIEIFKGSVAEGDYKNDYFDAVVIWHVLEHLHDPLVTLDEIARITRKDGIIAIAVPNFSSLQSNWFKSDWFHLDLPRHLYHFNVENLCQALTQRGYAVDSVSSCSLEQNIFGFVQSFMNKLKFLGKPNEFYQLLKKRSGSAETIKLALWLVIATLTLPFAVIEFVISCLLNKGASAIVFARKT